MRMRSLILLGVLGALSAPQVQGEEPTPGKQVEQELKLGGDESIRYLLFLPKAYGAGEKKWPCMLFLHGRGESQGPLQTVAKWGPPRLLARGEELPYIVVSPQCPPAPDSWGQAKQQQHLLELVEHVAKTLKVDEDRIYLTGLSMGGFGSWRLAADHPEKFAAVVPICGGGNPADAEKLKSLPIWAWHGGADPVVPVKRSEEMVEAIKAAGGTSIRLTTLAFIGHNSWEAAYASPELYQWLDKQGAAKNKAGAGRNAAGQ
jgi:predicted peptidase